MSQYIQKIDGNTEALVGWNPPLQSYVALVYRIDEDGKKKDAPIFKIGGAPEQLDNLEVFVGQLAPYVSLSDDIRGYLFFDRSQNR